MQSGANETSILIVDDDARIRQLLKEALSGYRVATASSGTQAVSLIRRQRFEVVLLDVKMPGMDGLHVLRVLKEEGIAAEIIMVTGHGNVGTAVEAMKLGAYDYVEKPFDLNTLRHLVAQASTRRSTPPGVAPATRATDGATAVADLIGVDPKIVALRTMIDRAAPAEAPGLSTGETGTGKDLVARAIHARSRRACRALVTVDCPSIPPSLFESELFGHERGAFTGAVAQRRGKLAEADGATLFLDEVGELTLDVQPKLLGFLQDGIVTSVGGNRGLAVDARIVAATNRDLATMVEEGGFRRDLFHRLSVVRVALPPLRERRVDLPLLITYFVERFCRDAGEPAKTFSAECLAMLLGHEWPGNVRELKNVIEQACILTPGQTITPEGLVPGLVVASTSTNGTPAADRLADVDRQHIADVLRREGWNFTRAARVLGIHRATLYRKVVAFGIRPRPDDDRAISRSS